MGFPTLRGELKVVEEFLDWMERLKANVPDHDLFECQCQECGYFRRWMKQTLKKARRG